MWNRESCLTDPRGESCREQGARGNTSSVINPAHRFLHPDFCTSSACLQPDGLGNPGSLTQLCQGNNFPRRCTFTSCVPHPLDPDCPRNISPKHFHIFSILALRSWQQEPPTDSRSPRQFCQGHILFPRPPSSDAFLPGGRSWRPCSLQNSNKIDFCYSLVKKSTENGISVVSWTSSRFQIRTRSNWFQTLLPWSASYPATRLARAVLVEGTTSGAAPPRRRCSASQCPCIIPRDSILPDLHGL